MTDARMTDEEARIIEEIEKMSLAQQELALALLVARGAVSSTALDNGQRNDLLCCAFNFYATSRAFAVLNMLLNAAKGDDGRKLVAAVAAAWLALREEQEKVMRRLDVLLELLPGGVGAEHAERAGHAGDAR
jgi:hypothetical protein